jgi:hypothetical protein
MVIRRLPTSSELLARPIPDVRAGSLTLSATNERFTGDAPGITPARANDEKLGHALSYLLSVQCRQAGHVLRVMAFMSCPRRAGAQAVQVRGF